MSHFEVLAANYRKLSTPISALAGVGEKVSKSLEKLGILTYRDLLQHYPRRYLDLSTKKAISQLKIGEEATVLAQIVKVEKRRSPRGPDILQVSVADKSSYLAAVWFNQNYLSSAFTEGDLIALSGKVNFRYGCFQMNTPLFEILDEEKDLKESFDLGRIIPLYPASKGLYQKQMRKWTRTVLEECLPLPDTLPLQVNKENHMGINRAFWEIHFPTTFAALTNARRRFVFEELLYLQMTLLLRKGKSEVSSGIAHKSENGWLDRFFSILPFTLTESQSKVIKEITADMQADKAMHRLLQGEVGAGKTVPAAAAMFIAAMNGKQAALMAPTEVLAYQHFLKIKEWFSALEMEPVLLTSAQKGKERQGILEGIKNGDASIVVGTHALIQDAVEFKQLSLVIVDEQHRFGVDQRLALREKGRDPDTLVMTATPIPRTLALTFYGDLDISVLDSLPSGRNPVETAVFQPNQASEANMHMREQLAQGRQGLVICPLVGEPDAASERKAVLQELENVRGVLPDFRVEALHGKLNSKEKLGILEEFANGEIAVLVSTTVVEVGIDVPNAAVILIQEADKFGLAQLHQLRGRVGRGQWPGKCILIAETGSEESRKRMDAMLSGADGFALAELDLELRGEGQLFGTRQSGLPDLKLASLPADLEILKDARGDALAMMNSDPGLKEPHNGLLKLEIAQRYEDLVYWLGSG